MAGRPDAAMQVELDADEQEVMDLQLKVMDRINGWGLQANGAELTQAVHVIQTFIVQHMLQRLSSENWGHWYDNGDS